MWSTVHLCLVRYRAGGGKTPNQLSVEELRSFVRQLYNLPCSLMQAPLLKVTHTHICHINLHALSSNHSTSVCIFLI